MGRMHIAAAFPPVSWRVEMKAKIQAAVLLTLVFVVAATASADEKKKKREKKAQQPAGIAMAMKMVQGVELTAEQKQKITEIGAEYTEKLAAIRTKVQAAYPANYQEARAAAAKEAKAAGKSGKELRQAVEAAAGLDEGAKAAVKEAQKESREVVSSFRAAVLAVLTDEQKAALPKSPEKKRKNKAAK